MEIARLLLERGLNPNMADKVGYLHNSTLILVTCDLVVHCICGLCV